MAAYRVLQLRRGTDAERQTMTPAAGELVWTTDQQELWVGDGSTVGGLGPIPLLAAIDHGSIAGLGDAADHTWAALVNGTRAITGVQTFSAGLVSNGATSLNALTTLTTVQLVALAPVFPMHNYTEENIDGGRESFLKFSGEKGDGTLHNLVVLRGDHIGTGDDQKARLRAYLNDGNDGLGDGTLFFTFTGEDGLAVFAGEVRTPVGRVWEGRLVNAGQTLSSLAFAVLDIQEDTADSGFSWDTGADELTVSFGGRLRVGYDGSGVLDNPTRNYTEWEIQHHNGTSWSTVPGSTRQAYHRTTSGGGSCSCSGRTITVASGHKIRWRARLMDTATPTVTCPVADSSFWAHRIQGAS